MARRLGATPFRDLLTLSIAADPTVRAAADALDGVLDAAVRAIPNALLFARLAHDTRFVDPVPMLPALARLAELSGGLAELPPEALDLLAWQLHVEGYDAAVSIRAKRELVSGSLLLHRRKGTPWTVRHALETALRLPAQVRQWFEYGGKPYFFRVGLDVTGAAFGPESAHNAFRLVQEHKNVRSWLEYLETRSTHTLTERVGVGLRGHTAGRGRLHFVPPPPPESTLHVGMVMRGHTRSRSRLYFTPPRPSGPTARAGLCLGGVTGGRLMAWCPPPRPAAATRRTAPGVAVLTSSRVGMIRALQE